MARTAFGAIAAVFAAALSGSLQTQVFAQTLPGGPPTTFYSSCSSGIGSCNSPSGWSYQVTVTDDTYLDTDDSTYWIWACEATSANGGQSYSSDADVTVTNTTADDELGSFAGIPQYAGASFATGHTASSSVTVGHADSGSYTLNGSTQYSNPYSSGTGGSSETWTTPTTLLLGDSYTFSDFISCSGSAG